MSGAPSPFTVLALPTSTSRSADGGRRNTIGGDRKSNRLPKPPKSPSGRGASDASEVPKTVQDVFRNLFKELSRTPISNDCAILQRSLLVTYQRFISPQRLAALIRREVRVGLYGVGALRFLSTWVSVYYARDVNNDRELRERLCDIALLKGLRRSSAPQLGALVEQELVEQSRCFQLMLITSASKHPRRHTTPHAAQQPIVISPRVLAAANAVMLPDPSVVINGSSAIKLSSSLDHSLNTSRPERNVRMFMACDSMSIAVHMLTADYELFSKIGAGELYKDSWKDQVAAPNLYNYVGRLDRISFFVSTMILVQPKMILQREVASKFIEVASFLREFGDFFGVMGIMSAFGVRSVSRIQKMWGIKKAIRELAKSIENSFDSRGNFKVQREYVAKCIRTGRPCVLHLAYTQRDITALYESSPDLRPDGSVNLDKIVQLGTMLYQVELLQRVTPKEILGVNDSRRNMRLAEMIRTLPSKTDAQLEELSHKIRPPKQLHEEEESAGSQWSTDDPSNTPSSSRGGSTTSVITPTSSTQTPVVINEETSVRSEDYVDL